MRPPSVGHSRRYGVATASVLALALVLALGGIWPGASRGAGGSCGPPVTSVIACENSQPGDPQSDWQVDGAGDTAIQGFATSQSVNVGQTISFKVNTPSTNYHIDILRLGYYQDNGARKIAAGIKPSATLPQSQPACLTQATTGLIDCGNWGVSASWSVPSTAVSGLYVAHLVRDDASNPSNGSLIPFVVRNDSSKSAVLVQTSDETWAAYNNYGGNSLYQCTTAACPPDTNGGPQGYTAAYAVSYNRPLNDCDGADDSGRDCFLYAEWPMIMFLEQNGYDVSYTSGSDVAATGSALLSHKLFISSAHDEYWSGTQRANVLAARDHGVNLAFFSGNEMFWKTRWAASIDGSNTANRTLITYKETHFTSWPVDPSDPPVWTGSWRDPRFSPPADGGNPENALTGQFFMVNAGTSDITVPSTYSKLRLWRNTPVASLGAGQSRTLGAGLGTLGYEWDEDADNGFRPAGLFDMSSTTVSGAQVFADYGTSVVNNQTAPPHLTLYRAPSGALVFGAGTVQWAWGLSDQNPSNSPPDPVMQQSTVNLFADMAVQPASLITGLTAASQSTDTTPPTSTITSPTSNSTVQDGNQITISGTASDSGGVVAGGEGSTHGGQTRHPGHPGGAGGANVNWPYTWVAHGNPSTTIQSRAVDDSGNIETPSAGVTLNVGCPCSIFGSTAPAVADSGDPTPVEVGVKFTSDKFGSISGIRFYKASANTGTHVGNLWSSSGQKLASATFTNESSSGWQTVTFSSPVQINANTTYIASYYAPNGHYSGTSEYFYPPPSPPPLGGGNVDSPPLHALRNVSGTTNGVYAYSGSSTFPTSTSDAANYWVDVLFTPGAAPGAVTNVSATAGYKSAQVSWTASSTGGAVTTYTITPYIGSTAQVATMLTGSPPATTATIPNLDPASTYTFTVQASNPNGVGPVSAPSNSVTPSATPVGPGPPTGVSASPATGQGRGSWTAPGSNGGSAITGYTVTPYIGSTAQTPVQVNNGSATSATVTGLTNGTSYTFTVAATNTAGPGAASAASNAVTPQNTIFDFGTPATVDSGDGSSVELGVKFTADTSGSITGIRFYKASTNTGTHVGSLWSSTGTLLASATSSGETASGWQTATFSTPVSITAGTTYVAGYLAPSGHYSSTAAGLSGAVDNPPLHSVANSTSVNGVYAYGPTSTFPTNSHNATNYWVDVLFAASGSSQSQPPGQVTGVTATAGDSSAAVSWTAPSSGAPTSYAVTPYIGSTAQTATTLNGSPPATSATINGLTNGTAYTFTVTASNAKGTGPASAQSNSVTPAPTGPKPTFVQQVAAHAAGVPTLPLTPGSNITAGNRLIVLVSIGSASGATAKIVTDSAGNNYTEVQHFTASDNTELSVWTAPLTAGGGTKPTITVGGIMPADTAAVALEYSGLSNASGSGIVDQSAHATGTTSGAATVSSGATAATASANELALGFYADSGFGNTLTAGNGWTSRANGSPTSDIELLAEEQILALGEDLLLGEELDVRSRRAVRAGRPAVAGGQRVAKARVSIEPECELVGGRRGRGRPRTDGGGTTGRAGGVRALIDYAGTRRVR